MIVHVEGAVFDRPSGGSFELLDVVHLCALGRHALVLEAGALKHAERWCDAFGGSMAGAVRDELKLARKRGLTTAQRGRVRTEIRLSASEVADWSYDPPRLGLRAAWHYLHQPLRLVVENVRSDGAFVRAMLLGDDGESLREAFADGRIAFMHGGGLGELRMFIEGTSGDRGTRIRSVLLFDHDGLAPAEPARPSRALREQCEREGVAYHQLQRRAIENYIPIKALRRGVERARLERRASLELKVDALATLAMRWPALRNHFNMKEGLCGDMREALPRPLTRSPTSFSSRSREASATSSRRRSSATPKLRSESRGSGRTVRHPNFSGSRTS